MYHRGGEGGREGGEEMGGWGKGDRRAGYVRGGDKGR